MAAVFMGVWPFKGDPKLATVLSAPRTPSPPCPPFLGQLQRENVC
jgi:hypothetical protein